MDSRPTWINKFSERVCSSIHLFDDESPFGCHYYLNDNVHEISIFVSSTEIVGGPNDGKQIVARFMVDLIELMKLFDVIDTYAWQPQVVDQTDEVGPHVAIAGDYAGEQIYLRILGETPSQFLPGRVASFTDRKFVNVWAEEG